MNEPWEPSVEDRLELARDMGRIQAENAMRGSVAAIVLAAGGSVRVPDYLLAEDLVLDVSRDEVSHFTIYRARERLLDARVEAILP